MPDMLMGDDILDTARAVTDEDREAATWCRVEADRLTHLSETSLIPGMVGCYKDDAHRRAHSDFLSTRAARYRRAAEALLRPDETAALRRLLAEAREAVVTCLDVWPDGAVGQKCADLLARIDAATKGGGK